jgi:hypothetical protein
MKSIFLILALFSFCLINPLYSQVEDISTDRPDQSESPYLMSRGYFQVETGIVYESDEPEKDLTVTALNAPSILVRYGLFKNIELRAGLDLLNEKTKIANVSSSESGFGPLVLGTKIKMLEEKGSTPETALLLKLSVPFKETSRFQSTYMGTEFRLAMTNNLNKKFSLSYNIGAAFGEGSPGATGIYSVSLGALLMKKLSVFAEIYGFLPQKTSPDHRFDAGLTYLIMKNVQVDASFGLGLSKKSPDYFIGGGVSFRLPK